MTTLPDNRNTGNTAAEHVNDHNALHKAFNEQFINIASGTCNISGTNAVRTHDTTQHPGNGTTSGLTGTILFPEDWSKIDVELLWRSTTNNFGNVVWDLQSTSYEVGMTGVTTTHSEVVATVPGVADPFVRTKLVSDLSIDPSKIWRFRYRRKGDAGSDTYPDTADAYSLVLRKKS